MGGIFFKFCFTYFIIIIIIIFFNLNDDKSQIKILKYTSFIFKEKTKPIQIKFVGKSYGKNWWHTSIKKEKENERKTLLGWQER